MSDINTIFLCGCLVADADFTSREGFISVKMRLATSHKIPKKDAPPEDRKVYHNIQTTIEDKPHLVDLWKQRCIKGARLTIQGLLDMDVIESPDGSKRYHLFIRTRANSIVLPDSAPQPATDQRNASTNSTPPRAIPAKLANSAGMLHF